MHSVEELVTAVEAGRGYLALVPEAVIGTDGFLYMQGVRTGRQCRYPTALQLAVRLHLEANPGIVTVADADEIAPGWSFGRGEEFALGGAVDDVPDMLVIGTACRKTMTQAVNIFHRNDPAAAAKAARTAARCAELRIPHGVATDEMREWGRAGSLLWQSWCVSMGATPEARDRVLAEIDAAGFDRPLGECLIRAASTAGIGIADTIRALGCLIFDGQLEVDFDQGALLVEEPVARRRLLRDIDRYPSSLIDGWMSAPSPLAAAA